MANTRMFFISLYVPWLKHAFILRDGMPTPSPSFYDLKFSKRRDRFFLGCQLITITEDCE
jgi:hypothetical protein